MVHSNGVMFTLFGRRIHTEHPSLVVFAKCDVFADVFRNGCGHRSTFFGKALQILLHKIFFVISYV